MSEVDNITTASSGESVLLAAQAQPTSSPINILSTASVVPAPTASQFISLPETVEDRWVQRGVLQALNPLSNRVTFNAIVPGTYPGESKMW